MTNSQIRLRRRPQGMPVAEDFELIEAATREPAQGEVLLRTIWLSLDPYMRGRMSAAKSYAQPVGIGEVMEGATVAQVVASRDPGVLEGAFVLARGGWQAFSVQPGREVMPLDPGLAPLSTALGILGMPGLTAHIGLVDIGCPKAGETVVVSAASGAVGAAAGQMARIMGAARVVGIAGGPDKCAYVRELGFDDCLDHRGPDLGAQLDRACPDGIDVYFENVGGEVQRAVFPRMADFGRMVMCGMIAEYNDTAPAPGPNLMAVVRKRLRIQGFIVSDDFGRLPAYRQTAAGWIADGRLHYREDIVDGLDAAPDAFIGLLQGRNFGKLLVAVGPDPTRP